MSARPVRIVIDTSVFIRYLIRPSEAIRHLIEEQWLRDQIIVISAPELMEELRGVLERKVIQAYIHPEDGKFLLEVLQSKAKFTPPLGVIPSYTRDSKDDKFVACAIAGQASYLITEDKDLLTLREIVSLKIVTPYELFTSSISPKTSGVKG